MERKVIAGLKQEGQIARPNLSLKKSIAVECEALSIFL